MTNLKYLREEEHTRRRPNQGDKFGGSSRQIFGGSTSSRLKNNRVEITFILVDTCGAQWLGRLQGCWAMVASSLFLGLGWRHTTMMVGFGACAQVDLIRDRGEMELPLRVGVGGLSLDGASDP